MLASAPATPATYPAAPAARRLAATPPERDCPYCCAPVAHAAKKCAACGEWVVGTSTGIAAALLRLLAWCWTGASLLVATGLWYAGGLVHAWVVARAVDPVVAPIVIDAAVYALIAFVLLQGLTVGVGLGVVAGLAPRRPRWWS